MQLKMKMFTESFEVWSGESEIENVFEKGRQNFRGYSFEETNQICVSGGGFLIVRGPPLAALNQLVFKGSFFIIYKWYNIYKFRKKKLQL